MQAVIIIEQLLLAAVGGYALGTAVRWTLHQLFPSLRNKP
jgi:hypothetical protein